MVVKNKPSFSQSASIEKETVEKPVKKKIQFIENQSTEKRSESLDNNSPFIEESEEDFQLEVHQYVLDDSDVDHILEDLIESNLDVGDEKQIIKIEDKPKFLTCFFHALQHFFLACGMIKIPQHLVSFLCIDINNPMYQGFLIQQMSANFLSSGLSTILETTCGSRLPIALVPSRRFGEIINSSSFYSLYSCPNLTSNDTFNHTLIQDIIDYRVQELSSLVLSVAVLQFIMGLTGIFGFAMKFLGPITIIPVTILSVLQTDEDIVYEMSTNWFISLFSAIILVCLTHVLRGQRYSFKIRERPINLNFTAPSNHGATLTIFFMWFVCVILMLSNAFSEEFADFALFQKRPSYFPQTSTGFYVPITYHNIWPRLLIENIWVAFSTALTNVFELITHYYLVCKLCDLPHPPYHAINRGVVMLACSNLINAYYGTCTCSISLVPSIAFMGLTGVSNRKIWQYSGIGMVIISMWLHLQVLTYQIPRPIFGGINFICYGMVLAVGVSMLSYLDLNQLRQPVIIGFTVFFSASLRKYFIFNSIIYRSEIENLSLTFRELLASVVIVGVMVSCVLDNILPASKMERGLKKWIESGSDYSQAQTDHLYNPQFQVNYRIFMLLMPSNKNSERNQNSKPLKSWFLEWFNK